MSEHDDIDNPESGVVTKSRARTKKPRMYRVLLLNDDFTPMEFVIEVLEKFFNKDHTAATKIMLSVHNKGAGICGVFPRDIAETKVALVNEHSRKNQHPLRCDMEVEA